MTSKAIFIDVDGTLVNDLGVVPALMAIADDITGSPDEDGLLTSFTKYGLV